MKHFLGISRNSEADASEFLEISKIYFPNISIVISQEQITIWIMSQ